MNSTKILSFLSVLILLGFFMIQATDYRVWNYDKSKYELSVLDQEYDMQTPKKRWDLPEELEEISGLAFYKKNQLACVQDEDGKLFIYSLKASKIVREMQFGDKGDYEGVEVIEDTAYVVKSNGKVYQFAVKKNKIGTVHEIETDLRSKNNAEGLGFNTDKSELLIACKEAPETKKFEISKSRAIYQIDHNEKKFKKKPKYIIDGKSYNEMLDKKGLSKKKHKPFKPSGVAVHPASGYIFVIGTVGKMMVILDTDGKIIDLIPLNPKIFVQPEGICFSPEGDLFISSEGKGKDGYILKF